LASPSKETHVPRRALGGGHEWAAVVFGALVAAGVLALPFTRTILFDVWGGLAEPSTRERLRRAPTEAERARGDVWFAGTISGFMESPGRPEGDFWRDCRLRAEVYSCSSGGSRGGGSCSWSRAQSWSYFTVRASGAGQSVTLEPRDLTDGRRIGIPEDDPYLLALTSAWHLKAPGRRVRYYRSCYDVGQPITVDGVLRPDGSLAPRRYRSYAGFLEDDAERDESLWDLEMWSAIAPLSLSVGLYWLWAIVAGFRTTGVVTAFEPLVELPRRRWRVAAVGALLGVGLAVLVWVRVRRHGLPFVVYPTFLFACGVLVESMRRRRTVLRAAETLLRDGAAGDLLCVSGDGEAAGGAEPSCLVRKAGRPLFTLLAGREAVLAAVRRELATVGLERGYLVGLLACCAWSAALLLRHLNE
jgi:hypothetical protein